MRVLQVTDSFAPAVGGLERVVRDTAHDLVRRGHPTMVATLSRPDSPATEDDHGVQVRRLDGLTRHLARFGTDPGHQFHPTTVDPQLVRRLNELVREFRPDVVHAHGWILNSCLSMELPPTVPLVATLHDYSVTCAKKTLIHRDELDRRCSGPALRKCLSCAAGSYGAAKGTVLTLGLRERTRRLDRVSLFLPISAAVAEAGLPGYGPDRYAVVPAFVGDGVAVEADGVAAPDFLPSGDFVLFVGALGEHKGVGLLADAHRRMNNAVPLVVIGAATADSPRPTGTTARPVIVRTGVPHPQIMASFARATVAAVPSRWAEPLGLVAVEAMAVGTPVVAARIGALDEVVLDERTGLLVPPGDPAALAAALDRLVDDPDLRGRLGREGRAHAARFTAAAVVPRLLNAYERARDTVPVG